MPEVLTRPPLAGLLSRAAGLASSLTTPLAPADFIDLFDPLRSPTLRARVVEVRPETRDALTLVLRPGRAWRGHRPGQYIRIGVDVDGVRHWRAYSVTSPPRTDGLISITVKAMPDGKVSTHLVRRARPGLLLQCDQAAGDFVLPLPRPSKTLFVTAGSGITPVMGMLRHAVDDLDDVVVVHTAPTPRDVIFGGELRGLAAAGRLRLVEWHSDTAGLMSTDDLDRLVPDLAERVTWACGPTGLLDALEGRFAAGGIADRLHTERFRPTVVVVGDGGTATFTVSGRSAEAGPATSLLDAGESAGVLMPSGCRMGICFGCVSPLQEGAVRDLRNGELTTATPDAPVLIQTCISAAAGACSIAR